MPTSTALLLLAAALNGSSAPPRSPGVVIEHDAANFTVRTTQPTTLRAVIEDACRLTQARCEWDEKALQALGAETVPAKVLRGTWTEILSQLLAGTSLNYAIFEPGDGKSGRLFVECRAAGGTTVDDEMRPVGSGEEGSPPGTPSPAIHPVTTQVSAEGAVGSMRPQGAPASGNSGSEAEPVDSSETPSPSAFPGSGVSGAGEAAQPEAVGFQDTPIAKPVYPFVSPFPDEMGNPVPVSEQSVKGSPFPDSQGIPAQVRPADAGRPHGSPFPP